MSFYQDRQIKGYCIFLGIFSALTLAFGFLLGILQAGILRNMYLSWSTAVASSLLEQGVPETAIADALTNSKITASGREFTAYLGLEHLPVFPKTLSDFQKPSLLLPVIVSMLLLLLLCTGTALFLRKREKLYARAQEILALYLDGDYSLHLPQNGAGGIYQIFAATEQFATMMQAKTEAEHNIKEFLKNTISDISHQLKTPLAALSMYQEILESEPDNPETVKVFSAKEKAALDRMEHLIASMLKITRLDAGSIAFTKKPYPVREVVARAVSDLTLRAKNEGKYLSIEGAPGELLLCDMDWTAEALGNLVKNALDHTTPGDSIRIFWEKSPAMLRILVSDTGDGIAPEDIHHIFKRFYRSSRSLDVPGIGLGLPLAKSITEGQGGVIYVQSTPGRGTTFTLSFLTES